MEQTKRHLLIANMGVILCVFIILSMCAIQYIYKLNISYLYIVWDILMGVMLILNGIKMDLHGKRNSLENYLCGVFFFVLAVLFFLMFIFGKEIGMIMSKIESAIRSAESLLETIVKSFIESLF